MRADWVVSLLANIGAAIGGAGVLLMMLHVTSDVLLRTAIGLNMPATLIAVSHYYMIAACFAPLALAEKQRAHIAVELIDTFLPPLRLKLIDLAVALITAFLMVALAMRSFAEAVEALRVGTIQMDGSHRVTTWPGFFILPFGASMMGAYSLVRAVRLLKNWRSP